MPGLLLTDAATLAKRYRLLGPDREVTFSETPGTLGGYRPGRIYGRLDCPSALRALARGGYAANRVFFRDEETAIAAGYRPCGICLKTEYARWKADPVGFRASSGDRDSDQ